MGMKLSCCVRGSDCADSEVFYQAESRPPAWEGCCLSLRPGLTLAVSRLDGDGGAGFDFEIEAPPMHFGFVVAGRNRCTYRNGRFRGQEHLLETGSNSILCLPKTAGRIACDPRSGACVLAVIAAPSFLEGYFAGCMGQVPAQLCDILEGRPDQMLWRGRPGPAKAALVRRVMGCLEPGPMRRLRLESMVLELVARQLEEYCADDGRPASPLRISRGDVDRLHEARRILLQDLENPPTLGALARASGLSDKKLKYGFREVFGTSVYEYFRSHRLELARELLADDRMSVSEVAYRVGYLNLSHFSQAFRSRYGTNPSDYSRACGR
ncbi:AraC family transcriptional regulator [Desulfovibrio aminophilus]|nr:AraC family transcriptional regulator [Desulfovibrio aminophilus]MCM0756505.1 AraC family transcriptional regulator [Desulfovibrio aminophilus]